MKRIGSTNQFSGARRAPLAGFGALAIGAVLAVVISSGSAAAESTAPVANVTVGTSASRADVLPGESLTVTATVEETASAAAGDVTLWVALPAGVTLVEPGTGTATVTVSANSTSTVSFEVVVDSALNPDVTELTVDVNASTGASASLTVTVLQQQAISVADSAPAATG